MLVVEQLTRSYRDITVLQALSFSINKGERVGLVGPSGAGKTTLLNLLGLLDRPTTGRISLDGHDYAGLSEKERTLLRRHNIGFIFQFHNLLPELNALENVALPLIVAGTSISRSHEQAKEWLKQLRIDHRWNHRPTHMSGGEQQRVAIARALVSRPKLILADEPTGNLDPETAHVVYEALCEATEQAGVSLFMATHNMELAERMHRCIEIGKK